MDLQITGFSQNSLSISSAAAQTSALENGRYSTANDVTTSTGFLLYANQMPDRFLIEAGHKIGAITSGSVGTLYYHRVS